MTSLVDRRNIHAIKRDLTGIAIFLAAIWIVFILDRFLPLEEFGLVPREPRGLIGIIAMPFLHGDFRHLLGNSIPLAVTLLLLAGSRANSNAIVALIVVLGGIGLWLFGRTALHIGASGLVFGLIAFHIFAGFSNAVCSRLLSHSLSVCSTHPPCYKAYCHCNKVCRGMDICSAQLPARWLHC